MALIDAPEDYMTEEEEEEDEEPLHPVCIFCGENILESDAMRFNFPSGLYRHAHYRCFEEQCRDLGTTEDGIMAFLDALNIETIY